MANRESQADGLQQRVTGHRKSRQGGAATCGSLKVEGQMLSQADTPDEVLTQTVGQTLAQNSNELFIRQDIASLVQEIVKYLGTVDSIEGTGQQESWSLPSKPPKVTTTTPPAFH